MSRKASKVAWLAGVIVALALVYAGLKFYGLSFYFEDAVRDQTRKTELLSQMRIGLLSSIEAEKSAVLAVTDESSEAFARNSEQAANAVEDRKAELAKLIDAGKSSEEQKLLGEFSGCWTEMRKIDKVLLELAVQNTNLKAARLSEVEGGEDIGRFERALEKLLETPPAGAPGHQIVRLVFKAIADALKIHYLHGPHIAEATDQRMDELEGEMRRLDLEVRASLEELSRFVEGTEQRNLLASAQAAYDDFQKVTAEVVKLSRQNSNVKSLQLSLGKKRVIAAQCEDILASLQEVVRSRAFKATR
jgi:hypothetical protein